MKFYKNPFILELLSLTPEDLFQIEMYTVTDLYSYLRPLKDHPTDDEEEVEYIPEYRSLLPSSEDGPGVVLNKMLPYNLEDIQVYLQVEGGLRCLSSCIKIPNYGSLYTGVEEYILKPLTSTLRANVLFNGISEEDTDFLIYRALFSMVKMKERNPFLIENLIEHFVTPIVLEAILSNGLTHDVDVPRTIRDEVVRLSDSLSLGLGREILSSHLIDTIRTLNYYRRPEEYLLCYHKDQVYSVLLEEDTGRGRDYGPF